ncbi:MAG TPA: hypothetical protein H9668_01830 [Firmicutes bacterium]|nr:hypothetical protein [Bacillota bacterium]
MLHQIKAEFETIDLAERAAHRLRREFSGIRQMDIYARKYHDGFYDASRIVQPGSPNAKLGYSVDALYAPVNYFDAHYGRETGRRRTATLELRLEAGSPQRAAGRLRNLGGLSVRTRPVAAGTGRQGRPGL